MGFEPSYAKRKGRVANRYCNQNSSLNVANFTLHNPTLLKISVIIIIIIIAAVIIQIYQQLSLLLTITHDSEMEYLLSCTSESTRIL